MAIFFAATKLPLMGMDSERSSMITVAERLRASVRSTSKSVGESSIGVPGPRRERAFRTVRSIDRLNGSPHS